MKSIELIEKELNELKKQIKEKDNEIKMLNEEIMILKEKTRAEMLIMIEDKNKGIAKEMKELKEENRIIKSRFDDMEKNMEALKVELKGKQASGQAPDVVIEEETEVSDTVKEHSIICGKCEFVAKSESGLKTHMTVKHKTPLFKAYSKISR